MTLVLVDTTVWIDLLRGTQTAAVPMLRQLLSDGRALVSPVVVQELLQGARSPAGLQRVTPRSPHDCLIAQIAIDHDLEWLHDDRDFDALAQVDGRLRLVRVTAT